MTDCVSCDSGSALLCRFCLKNIREEYEEALVRCRAALKRLTSPSWGTNLEQDILAAEDAADVGGAAHVTVKQMQAIARAALKDPE